MLAAAAFFGNTWMVTVPPSSPKPPREQVSLWRTCSLAVPPLLEQQPHWEPLGPPDDNVPASHATEPASLWPLWHLNQTQRS